MSLCVEHVETNLWKQKDFENWQQENAMQQKTDREKNCICIWFVKRKIWNRTELKLSW